MGSRGNRLRSVRQADRQAEGESDTQADKAKHAQIYQFRTASSVILEEQSVAFKVLVIIFTTKQSRSAVDWLTDSVPTYCFLYACLGAPGTFPVLRSTYC